MKKRILVTNHWLKKWGGSETFTYTLIGELVRRGHEVDLFTHVPGLVSDRIKNDFGVVTKIKGEYDLILANHNTTVECVYYLGKTVQTCHGVIPKLERPSGFADTLVAVSEEVQEATGAKHLIRNGIDCERFSMKRRVNTHLKKVLSMVFSDQANAVIKEACDMMGVEMIAFNKHKNPVFHIEKEMNKVDMVIGLGRCAFEAMSCGRPVVVYDNRPYMESYADGYLDMATLGESIKHNCSGRRYKKKLDAKGLAMEMEKYRPEDGMYLRAFAERELNIVHQVTKYLEI